MHNTLPIVNTQYTIILGAEGELGRAMAREVARKKCNLILVSTTSIDLQRFAIGLQLKEEVQVEAIKLDLGDQEAIQNLTNRLRDNYEVRALINNITCDWSVAKNSCISELAQEDFLTRFRGTSLVTRSLLPQMRKFPASYIQHIIPFPFKKEHFSAPLQQSVSKMYAFTKELDEELKHTGVSVSMVYTAPIKNIMEKLEFTGRIFEEEILTLVPSMIAMKAVNGMLRGDRLIIPGFWNKVQFFLNRHLTNWFKAHDKGVESSLQPSL
ncbi:MAG: SDR family NAD(P)-dependent oxidoreductase [Bacteroidia bacterium]|nr:MAG: SDR family NAD(P)-dependent oxidoreductase [Bacteroidia bacterium]